MRRRRGATPLRSGARGRPSQRSRMVPRPRRRRGREPLLAPSPSLWRGRRAARSAVSHAAFRDDSSPLPRRERRAERGPARQGGRSLRDPKARELRHPKAQAAVEQPAAAPAMAPSVRAAEAETVAPVAGSGAADWASRPASAAARDRAPGRPSSLVEPRRLRPALPRRGPSGRAPTARQPTTTRATCVAGSGPQDGSTPSTRLTSRSNDPRTHRRV